MMSRTPATSLTLTGVTNCGTSGAPLMTARTGASFMIRVLAESQVRRRNAPRFWKLE